MIFYHFLFAVFYLNLVSKLVLSICNVVCNYGIRKRK